MKSEIYIVTVYEDGGFQWKLNGKLHREDGPAVKTSDGIELYYINGESHREDGPAIKYPDGAGIYYLNNRRYSKEEFDIEIIKRMYKFKKSLACENKEVIIEGVKYKLIKV